MTITTDEAFLMLYAVIRQWISDARHDGRDRFLLAQFLDCQPDQLAAITAQRLQPLKR